jgi:hypothetical protein
MPAVARLSQAIAEGDGISILVEVDDAESAELAERQGADGLVAGTGANAVRASSQLPLLHRGGTTAASGVAADAIIISPDLAAWDEAQAFGLEGVVRIARASDLERALHFFDPEIVLLTTDPESDEDELDALLALLHDVPAGKLAIAELKNATPEDVAELERAGVDAVLVAAGNVETLVQDGPPEV